VKEGRGYPFINFPRGRSYSRNQEAIPTHNKLKGGRTSTADFKGGHTCTHSKEEERLQPVGTPHNTAEEGRTLEFIHSRKWRGFHPSTSATKEAAALPQKSATEHRRGRSHTLKGAAAVADNKRLLSHTQRGRSCSRQQEAALTHTKRPQLQHKRSTLAY
jgi:hypothetical protein